MKRKQLLTLAVATAIAGTTMLGATSATSDYMHYQDGTISICDLLSNGTKCITMKDRNEGAINNDITSTGSYGFHYQRGNNYGFSSCSDGNLCESVTIGQRPNTTGFGPGNYYSGNVFRVINNKPYDWSNTQNDNLRGGSDDNQGNDWGYDIGMNVATNVTGRQGPCDTGYHIPSIGERNLLLIYYLQNYNNYFGTEIVLQDGNQVNGLKKISDSMLSASFLSDFKIPFAGYRNYWTDSDWSGFTGAGAYAGFWSSSPDVANRKAYRFGSSMSNVVSYPVIERGYGASLRCFKNYSLTFPIVEPTDDEDFTVTIGGNIYTGLDVVMEVTTNNEVEVEADEPVVGEVSVDFGENVSAKFNKLVQVNIPVSDYEDVIVKVKHEGSSEYNFDGLTLNRNATCNDNGRPTSNQYNGEIISVVDGYASIYTCEASSFVALGLGSGEAIGEVTLTLTAGENTCTLNDYNLGTHNVSSEDQNVSTSGQDIVCEFLKNTSATIQLSMGDLIDGTKEIGRQYFTGIVTSLGNSLGTIANLTGGSYNFSGSHIIYTKEANTIGTWTGSLAIEGIIPAGTPGGQYTGELNVIICEGC